MLPDELPRLTTKDVAHPINMDFRKLLEALISAYIRCAGEPSPDMTPQALGESKVFCVLPWLGLNIAPNGDVYPCCAFVNDSPVGSLRTARLEEIWNSESWRDVRRRMLAGEEVPQCRRCYELEAVGSCSLRQQFQQVIFSRPAQVRDTNADGSLDRFAPANLDIRFSNRCNFKCRYCTPQKSARWRDDCEPGAIDTPTKKTEDLLRQLGPILAGLDQINFSGGEPLLTPEHYQLLGLLIEKKKTYVRLNYSTNFSVTTLGGRDVFELWKGFTDEVVVAASLDAMGGRGEYIRKNQDWSQVVENRERMLRVCPRVRFSLAPTLSVMNALHLPEFHKAWIEQGYVEPRNIAIGFVLDPEEFRAQILPEHLKREMAARYERHMEWLSARYGSDAAGAVAQFKAALDFTRAQDRSGLLDRFRRTTRSLDAMRGERFESVFPELAELMQEP